LSSSQPLNKCIISDAEVFVLAEIVVSLELEASLIPPHCVVCHGISCGKWSK
jgi:hypothetical protein